MFKLHTDIFDMTVSDRYTKAFQDFDSYNSEDPNKEEFDGRIYPKELLYAIRMSEQLGKFAPSAPEEVKLAVRCQHIGRWEIPRSSYPMDKKGYLQWRNTLKVHHAKVAGTILQGCGYDSELIEKVKFLLLKKELNKNEGTQLVEDVICLVFVHYYLEEFASRHDDDKVIDILRKTMKKMSPRAIAAVGNLPLSEKITTLITAAAG